MVILSTRAGKHVSAVFGVHLPFKVADKLPRRVLPLLVLQAGAAGDDKLQATVIALVVYLLTDIRAHHYTFWLAGAALDDPICPRTQFVRIDKFAEHET